MIPTFLLVSCNLSHCVCSLLCLRVQSSRESECPEPEIALRQEEKMKCLSQLLWPPVSPLDLQNSDELSLKAVH